MADASIDLYADDLDQDYNQKDDFGGDGVDLYDDVLTAQPGGTPRSDGGGPGGDRSMDRSETSETNGGYHHIGNNLAPNHMGRRYQLYIGNLNWWTTDQDIADVIEDIGVKDFQDVKFFENRANGQSKGFCVITLGSESSMRLTMDRLPKKTMHGQIPMVTPATKQALNQFESQQKTRPNPPPSNGPRGPPSSMGGPPPHQGGPPPGHQPRMMNPNGPPHIRGPPHMQGQMRPGGPPGQPGGPGGPRMDMPMHQGGGHMNQPPQGPQGPPRFQSQGQWNGPPRPSGPPRQGPMPGGPSGPPQHRPMFQGGPGGPPRGVRPDWNRPPMHGGFPGQGPPQGHPQGPPHMQGPPRGPPSQPMVGPPHAPHPQPAPHVNPAFFNQGGGPGAPQHPPIGPPHGGPQQNMQPHPPPHFGQGAPRGPWPGATGKPVGPPFQDQGIPTPQVSEAEFEEIMARNRTVSSSAIARAVSDAAAGEYSSAIETLVTAISLIKQSKVAQDERCKILISSLQDTLHGIETKSYSRRERSRSRDRSHRRARRERSTSRYRERSRERDRDRDRERDREREGRYHSESSSYRESAREGRDRSRSRDRGGGSGGDGGGTAEHYRDESSRSRPRKSSEMGGGDMKYYIEPTRDRERIRRDDERRQDRDEHRSRH